MAEVEFLKYSSIKAADYEPALSAVQVLNLHREEWVISEKVHGANFGMWIDEDGNVLCSKRSGFLVPGDPFNDWERVRDEHLERLREVKISLDVMGSQEGRNSRIAVFGELCGGYYPDHASFNRGVHQGVWYSPQIQFLAFDILVETETGEAWYMNPVQAREILTRAGFLVTPELGRGSLNECLEYDPNFNSYVPAMLGLPELETNQAEGYVIAPQVRHPRKKMRVIFKIKNVAFQEKNVKIPKPSAAPVDLAPEEQAFLEELEMRVTRNRFDAVRSKELEDIGFGRLIGLMTGDIVASYRDDNPGEIEKLEKSQRKRVTRLLNKTLKLAITEWRD